MKILQQAKDGIRTWHWAVDSEALLIDIYDEHKRIIDQRRLPLEEPKHPVFELLRLLTY